MFSFLVSCVSDDFLLFIKFSYFYFTYNVLAWLSLFRNIISYYSLANFIIYYYCTLPRCCKSPISLSLPFYTVYFFIFSFVILDYFMLFYSPFIMSLTRFFSYKSSYFIFVTLNSFSCFFCFIQSYDDNLLFFIS